MPTRRGGLQHIRIKAKEGARKSITRQCRNTKYRLCPYRKSARKTAYCFLWTTAPCLTEAFELIGAWGFTYKTVAFTWIKQCRKSNRRKSRSVSSVIVSHIEEHSKKPDEARARIEALNGEVPKIELFARQTVGGWDCWGNETEKFGRY